MYKIWSYFLRRDNYDKEVKAQQLTQKQKQSGLKAKKPDQQTYVPAPKRQIINNGMWYRRGNRIRLVLHLST